MLNENDTSGFYSNNNGLLHAPNFVDAPTYQLNRGDKDTYTYPVNGWYWFDSIEEAANFFGIELPKEEEENKDEQNYF